MAKQYIYLGDRSQAHTNVITICYDIEIAEFANPELNCKVIRFGVSFSNKKDKYSKLVGKKIAEIRYHSNPCRVFKTKYGTLHSILTAMQKNEHVSWADEILDEQIFLIEKKVDI